MYTVQVKECTFCQNMMTARFPRISHHILRRKLKDMAGDGLPPCSCCHTSIRIISETALPKSQASTVCQAFHECCRPSMSVISKHLQLLWSDVEMNHRIYLQAESQVSIISGSPHITCLKLILSNVTTLQLQEEARTKSFHLCNITHVSLFLSYWRQKFQK
jgi:hypothetical protein